jgi:fucose 4-O-acetylase-like acetyltransferase
MRSSIPKPIKSRIETIDLLRGCAILFVVAGHVLQGSTQEFDKNIFFRILYSFHMPFFMFVSGMTAWIGAQFLFESVSNNVQKGSSLLINDLLKKLTRLLIPFFIWGCAAFYLRPGIPAKTLGEYLQYLVRHPDIGLWFLPALFWCFIILYVSLALSIILCKYGISKKNAIIVTLGTSFIALRHMPDYLALYLTKIYYLYFIFGVLWMMVIGLKMPSGIKEIACIGYILLFPLYSRVATSILVNKTALLIHCDALQQFYLTILGTCGILLFYGIVLKNQNYISGLVKKLIVICSKKSLDIYAIHFYFLGYFVGVFDFLFTLTASLTTSLILRQSSLVKFFVFGEIPKRNDITT